MSNLFVIYLLFVWTTAGKNISNIEMHIVKRGFKIPFVVNEVIGHF